MKFSIARSTAQAIYAASNEITLSTGNGRMYVLPSNEAINANDKLANVSIRGEETNLVVEVNDEIVLRYLALYIKTLKLVTPMVKAAVSMWDAVQNIIKPDCEEFVAFITKRKE